MQSNSSSSSKKKEEDIPFSWYTLALNAKNYAIRSSHVEREQTKMTTNEIGDYASSSSSFGIFCFSFGVSLLDPVVLLVLIGHWNRTLTNGTTPTHRARDGNLKTKIDNYYYFGFVVFRRNAIPRY